MKNKIQYILYMYIKLKMTLFAGANENSKQVQFPILFIATGSITNLVFIISIYYEYLV